MRHAAVLGCTLLIACSDRSVFMGTTAADDDGSDGIVITEGGTDGTQGTGGDMDPSGCDPSDCADICDDTHDQCYFSFDGVCTDDGTCVCEPPILDCLPCGSAGPCLEWETCYDEFSYNGECDLLCGYTFEFVWDAAVGCVIQLDPQLDDFVFTGWYVRIGDMSIDGKAVFDAVCTSPESWVLDVEQKLLTLCPTACAWFETAGVLETGWAFTCE